MKKIKEIHGDIEVVNGVLHIKGRIKGCDLEKINSLFNGSIYIDEVVGVYNHPKDIYLKVGRNNGRIKGDLSNTNICNKSNKKLKRGRRLALKGKGWL